MRLFQESPTHFAGPGKVQQNYELLYYTLGRYYCGIGKIDEAIICFRKILTAKKVTFSHMEAAYGGLHSAYQIKGNMDSVAKYAQLYVAANDSSYVNSTVDAMYKIQAMHNYQRYQRNALVSQLQNEKLKLWGILGGILLIVIGGMLIAKIKKSERKEKKRMVALNIKYNHAVDAFNCVSEYLDDLKHDYNHYKFTKEQELEQLNSVLSQYNEGAMLPYAWDKEKNFLKSDLVKHFHQQAQVTNSVVTDEEWECLENLVKSQMPDFWNFLKCESNQLTDKEFRISLLCKLHFIPSEMALLMGMGVQQISNIRSKINKKLFNKSGAKGLDVNMRRIK